MRRLWQGYFALLGGAAFSSGLLEFLATAAGHQLNFTVIVFSSGTFRGLWGGLVTIFSGIFLLRGLRDFSEVHQLAKLLMGCILLWIMAATDIFALIAAAIPGSEPGSWFNSLSAFLKALAPPYTSAVVLLPFSLPVLIWVKKCNKRESEAQGG